MDLGDAVGGENGSGKVGGGGDAVKVRYMPCEKQGKIREAVGKLKSGMRFSEEAAQHSEDKARQGVACVGRPEGQQ